MNKKQIIFTLITLLAVSSYVGYGYVTRKTYYPNGQLQSVTPYKFYKKDGLYKEYYENGQPKMSVEYRNNLKTGIQLNYFQDGISLKTPYINGVKDGIAKLYYSDTHTAILPLKNNKLTGKINLGGQLDFQINEDGSIFLDDIIKGKLVCSAQELIDNIAVKDIFKRKLGLSKCVIIEHFEAKNVGTSGRSVSFNGAFQFPHFLKDSTLTIVDGNNTMEKSQPIDMAIIEDMPNIVKEFATYNQHYYVQQATITYNKKENDITVTGFNKDKKVLFEANLIAKNLSRLLEKVYQTKELSKEDAIFTLFKDTTIQKYLFYTPQDKKNVEFIGEFGIEPGLLSNGSHFDFYNAAEKIVLKLTKIEKGMNIKLTYPTGDKDFLNMDIKVDNPGYNELIQKIKSLPQLNSTSLEKIKKSTNPLMLIPTSVHIENLSLKDYTGNYVLTAKSLAIVPFLQQITGDINLYQDNQIYRTYRIMGDLSQIEVKMLDNTTMLISEQEIGKTIDANWIKVQKENIVSPWIKEAEDEIKNPNKTSMTFAYLGGIEGYNNALNYHTAVEIADLTRKYGLLINAALEAHKTSPNASKTFIIPAFGSFNLPTSFDPAKILIEGLAVSNNSIEMKISFLDNQTSLCEATADTLNSKCQDGYILYTFQNNLSEDVAE